VKKKKKNNNKERVEKHKKRELLSSGILTDSNENASDYPINEQVEHFATYKENKYFPMFLLKSPTI
jgi:hypothetical protein